MATTIVAGNTYTLKNVYTGKMLNLYAGLTANGTNVCQYTADGSNEQKWTWGSDNKLYTYGSTTKCLDRYNNSSNAMHNNADIWTNNDDTNQKLIVSPISDSSYVTIKISGTNLFLTAYYGTANGANTDVRCVPGATGNVFWATSSDDTVVEAAQQKWMITLVEEGTSVDEIPEEVIVTGMPEVYVSGNICYPNGKEYFHPDSGMINGSWEENGGETIDNKLAAFYQTVFDEAPGSKSNYLYSLYGSKTISNDPDFNGTYHHGVDICNRAGAEVYTAHAGTVKKASGNTIAIFDHSKNVTYLYLHCNILVNEGDVLKVGDLIGTQGNRGLGYGDDIETNSHVHLEVRSDEDTTAVSPSSSLSVPIPTLNPYDYI